MVYFDDNSKAVVKVTPSDSVADVLEKVRDKVTSSAALLWAVDNEGHGQSCDQSHVSHVTHYLVYHRVCSHPW